MPEPVAPQRPLMMFGEAGAAACVDGVCAVPDTAAPTRGGAFARDDAGAQEESATSGVPSSHGAAHQAS